MMRFPEHAPENNPFSTVVVDLTHRCNMQCANCYLPNRHIPDMDLDRLIDCVSRFPRRTVLRLAGAEPTLRADLPEIIRRVRFARHRPVVMTNGLRLANADYVRKLRDAGLRHVYISMNGADEEDWYERLDNLRCAEKKVAALSNSVASGFTVNTGTILVPDLNEAAVGRLVEMVRNLAPRAAILRFRNVGPLGRHMNGVTPRFDLKRMTETVCRQVGVAFERAWASRDVEGREESTSRFFPLVAGDPPGRGIWIKVTDWSADSDGVIDPASPRRGRITSDFRVAPFFEHVLQNEFGF